MEYMIQTISDPSEIRKCPVFQVDQYNWGGDYRPKTWGALAFIPDRGFYVSMTSEEKDPPRTYTHANDPVCLDSAMEAFFQFYPKDFPEMYLNFEANANGALHAKYGNGRNNRTQIPLELNEACQSKSTVLDDRWTWEMLVPLKLIQQIYGKSSFKTGDEITCNFFKIKESEGMTHFGSYTVIEHETPNFHLTKFFAKGILTE